MAASGQVSWKPHTLCYLSLCWRWGIQMYLHPERALQLCSDPFGFSLVIKVGRQKKRGLGKMREARGKRKEGKRERSGDGIWRRAKFSNALVHTGNAYIL